MNYDVLGLNPSKIQQLQVNPASMLKEIRQRYAPSEPSCHNNKDTAKIQFQWPYVATDLAYDDALRTMTRLYRKHNCRTMLLVFINPEDNELDSEMYVRSLDDQWKYRPTGVSRMGNTLYVPLMSEWEWTEVMATEGRQRHQEGVIQSVTKTSAQQTQ